MIASQSCKFARHARWRSTGHGRLRPDIRQPSQIVGQLIAFDARRRAFVSRFTIAQLDAAARFKSASSPAAIKSP